MIGDIMNKYGGGLNQENIQNMNRTLILNLLRKEGVCSRVHLSHLSQLKQATVTNIVNDFLQWGIVKEVGFLVGSKGRRSIGISINNEDFAVLSIRLARTNYSVGVFNLSGGMIKSERIEYNPGQYSGETFQSIINNAKKIIANSQDRKILAIGMAIPGPYSERRGRIELMTGVIGWDQIPIKESLQEVFKIPVFIEQDANAGALAQFWHSERDFEKGILIYIAVGQGIGAGIINNGRLVKGSIGVAGEIGHTSINFNGPTCACGNRGCLENYCSSTAFLKRLNEELDLDHTVSFKQASELVKNGDKKAVTIYTDICTKLAFGVVNVINSFNPSVIILGDEMAHVLPELMLECVKKVVKTMVIPEIYKNTEITMSVVKNDSMSHGAAIVAINDIFFTPDLYF